jgi:predicted alpha-1,6-mannanase (GH76 family)
MNTTELKSDLQKFIIETNDIGILTQMYEYIERLKKAKTSDWWDSLSIEQQEIVNKGLADLETGNFYTDEEVRKSIHQRILEAQ